MLLAANSMMPFVLPVAMLPLSHLCLVKIVQFIVVIVSRPSVPLVLPAEMIAAATVAVVIMEVEAAAVAVVAVVGVAVVVVAIVVVIAAAVGSAGLLMIGVYQSYRWAATS